MDLKELQLKLSEVDENKISELDALLKNRNCIFLIGNGGSNSVCSHIAQDYTKAKGLKALAFSDPSRLTCYINDYGRDEAYKMFLQHFADHRDFVILISSSGNSQNIVNSANYCNTAGIDFAILTGFDEGNKLRQLHSSNCKLDYHVSSHDYGIVENMHCIFLHAVI